jgi:ribosomal silencing factor RsfS
MCNRFITSLANATLKTHAMSHKANAFSHLTIVELQNFLNRLVVYSPHSGRHESSLDDNTGNGARRGNGKRAMNNRGGKCDGNGCKYLVWTYLSGIERQNQDQGPSTW